MGTNTNQIATEYNTESSYGTYINSTTPTKCITVNRLLNGLLETNNNPSYLASDLNSGFTNKYHIKSWGSSPVTGIKISKSSSFANTLDDDYAEIINTGANNYGVYPFSTGTAFLALNSSKTITATITIDYRQRSVTILSTDDVSPTSMDFDNPADDTEPNTYGQEPTLTGNTRGTIDKCENQGSPVVTCECIAGGFEVYSPPTPDCPCMSGYGCSDYCTGDTVPCNPLEIVPTQPDTYGSTIFLSLQLYNGVNSFGYDNYINISEIEFSSTVTLNTGISKTFTLSIPTYTTFPIVGTPSGPFRFRLKANFDNFFESSNSLTLKNKYTSASITATMPQINAVVYNPGPKCIKYNDLSTVYSLYGK